LKGFVEFLLNNAATGPDVGARNPNIQSPGRYLLQLNGSIELVQALP
jgi:hypothetical protein